MTESKEYLTYDQVSEIFNIKKGTLYSMVNKKALPFIRLSGRIVRFDKGSLDKFFEACTQNVEACDEQR